ASRSIETNFVTTATRVRPFTGVGFKAYFDERAFFRGEARFNPGRTQLDQMAWTAGVGIDFATRRQSAPSASMTRGGSAVRAQTPPRDAQPRAAEPVDVWRAYASKLQTGVLVDLTIAGGERLTGTFLGADETGINVRPAARVPEPLRHVTYERLEQLALHPPTGGGSRVGSTAAGIAAGA